MSDFFFRAFFYYKILINILFENHQKKQCVCFSKRQRVCKNSSNSLGISYLYPNYYVVHGNASITYAAL